MLARWLRPPQTVGMRTMTTLLGVTGWTAVVIVLMPSLVWSTPSWWFGLSTAFLPGIASRRWLFGLLSLLAVALCGALVAVIGAGISLRTEMSLCALLLVPLAVGYARVRGREELWDSCEAGLGFIGPWSQLIIAAALLSGWSSLLGLGAALLGALGVHVAVWSVGGADSSPTARRRQPVPVLPVRAVVGHPMTRSALILLILVLLVPVVMDPARLPARSWLGLAMLVLGWRVLLGRLLPALLVVSGAVGGLLLPSTLAWSSLDHPAALLGESLIPAQALPLWWWWWRFHRSPGMPLMGCLVIVLLLLSAPHPYQAVAMGISALLGTAVLHALRGDPPVPMVDAPSRMVARAWGFMPPFWRLYLHFKIRLDPMFPLLLGDARPWGEVVDVGCGPGLGLALARCRSGTRAFCGIDLDAEKLLVARQLLAASGCPLDGEWRLLHGRLPFPQPLPKRFDTVLMLDVLHYWPPGEQQALIEQLRACLRPEGELWLREALTDHTGSAGRVASGERFTTRIGLNPSSGQLHFPSAVALEAMLHGCGLVVVERIHSGAENQLWRCRLRDRATGLGAGQAVSAG